MRNFINRIFQGESNETVMKAGKKTFSINETGLSKTLSINGTIQSVLMKNSDYSHDYWDLFPPLCYAFSKPRIFMIGLGGGTIAKQIDKKFGENAYMDIAEIDGKIVELARRFFGLGSNQKIIVGDGANILHLKKDKYDIIILDAYEGDVIPKQFLNEKFIKDAQGALKSSGILAINYISTMRINGALEQYMSALSKCFDVYEARIQKITWNSMIICAKGISKGEIIERIGSGTGYGNYERQILSAFENMEPFSVESDMH